MMEGQGWEPTFLAVSTLLGEPLDIAASALDEARASQLLAGPFGASSRLSRATAVARTVTALVTELERSRLA
jgi:hypothetical protein